MTRGFATRISAAPWRRTNVDAARYASAAELHEIWQQGRG